MIAASLKDGDDLVKLFLSKDADINEKSESILNIVFMIYADMLPDFSGQTVLHFVASKNNLDLAKQLLSAKPPASARVKDKRGQYAIHRAAAVGSVPMVELLLKHNSPINATDIDGQTPLHHAVAEGHGDTVVALLKAGAETDKKDSNGHLAMELAPDSQVYPYYLFENCY
jgi:26S proteasome non-ATPase regulatory subunit 10